MAAGNQEYNGKYVTSGELRLKYDELIKETIIKANPDLDVFRADDFYRSGAITTDIIARIMQSDYVVVDITFPNYNVFYELGLRHACKPGTVIIREQSTNVVPIDIAHLRYIEYINTSAGLEELSNKLKQYFESFDKAPNLPDNHFLETAKSFKYKYPKYDVENNISFETEILMAFIQSPELFNIFTKLQNGEAVEEHELIKGSPPKKTCLKPYLSPGVPGSYNEWLLISPVYHISLEIL
jgi:hypothetical protein